jgi:membrane protease YdiL (CAAX protease family)
MTPIKIVAIVLIIAGGLALLAFNAAYGWMLERLGFSPPDVPEMLRGMLPMPLVVLWAALLAPLVEELYFRGRFLEALEARTGPWMPAAVTSVVFAAIHMIPEFFPALYGRFVVHFQRGDKEKALGLLAKAKIPILRQFITRRLAEKAK